MSIPAALDTVLAAALAICPLEPSDLAFRTDYEPPDAFRLSIVDQLLVNPRATAAVAESLASELRAVAHHGGGMVAKAAAAVDLELGDVVMWSGDLGGVGGGMEGAIEVAFRSVALRIVELEKQLATGLEPVPPADQVFFVHEGPELLALTESDERLSIEAIAAEDSASSANGKRVLAIASTLDRSALVRSGASLAAFAEVMEGQARRGLAMSAVPTGVVGPLGPFAPWAGPAVAEGDVRGVWALPDGRPIVLGGPGTTRYLAPCALILDLGGDDSYLGGAGGNGGEAGRLALAVDMGGDDTYEGKGPFTLAAAALGAGVLIDVAGNDVYRAGDEALGAGFGGVGLLVDRAGDDHYLGAIFSCGAGAFGCGLLVDEAGGDFYQGSAFTQGFGFVGGIGVLHDVEGEDVYLAAPRFSDQLRDPTTTMSLAQGFGYGLRPDGSGGIGLLIDDAGQDRYLAEVFAQGAAYWCALGGLLEGGGNDHYDGFNYVQGSGVHVAVAALVDREGNDVYRAKGVAQGCGHDLAAGILADGAGDDRYDASDLAQGAGNANGIGILADLGGDDVLTVRQAATSQAYANARRNRGSVGVLANVGGSDRYLGGRAGEGKLWLGDEHAVGFDGDRAMAAAIVAAKGRAMALPAGFDWREVGAAKAVKEGDAADELPRLEPPPKLPPASAIPESVRAMPLARLFQRAAADEPRFTSERDQARAEFVRRGAKTVPELVRHLGTESAVERHALKDLAVALGPERVEKPFARVLAADDERAARAAAWCLERSEAKGVEGELMRAASHASWRVRSASITALARGGGERSRATLVAALADPEAPVRHAAAHALGERAVMAPLDQEALRALAGALADSDATVRFAAAHALGHAGLDAVPFVGETAGPATRAGVAARVLALGETGDAGTAAGIRTLLDEARKAGDPLLEAWCLRALDDAGAMEAGADSAHADSAGADSVRAILIRAVREAQGHSASSTHDLR
jgi:HEAT repeat protein